MEATHPDVPNQATAAAKAAIQVDSLLRAEDDKTPAAEALTAAAAAGLGAAGGGGACAVARLRCSVRVAFRALGGLERLCFYLSGPDGKPPASLRHSYPARTLAAVAGCLEVAVSKDSAAQEEAASRQAVGSLLRLVSLSQAELQKPPRASLLTSEPELLPNLLLSVSALVAGAPKLQASLRSLGGIEMLLSLVQLPTGAAPNEQHVLALDALQAAGETQPEVYARRLELASPKRADGAKSPHKAAISGVHAVRALERLARPLTDTN
jgi:hypothetical protein